MTSVQRIRLETAAIDSAIEDVKNVDPEQSMEETLKRIFRGGHRGYAQMDAEELLSTIKEEVGWEHFDRQFVPVEDDGTTKMRELIVVIDEIVGRREFKVGDELEFVRKISPNYGTLRAKVLRIDWVENRLRRLLVEIAIGFNIGMMERPDGDWDRSDDRVSAWRIR